MMTADIQSYRARWVIPVAGPPVANGIVVLHGERIVGIHRTRRPDTVDLGDVAILPGLVNCHTHLEFSALPEPLRPMQPFTAWIRAVINSRRTRNASVADAIQQGLQESLLSGVTLLGDIATTGWTWKDYDTGPDCVVFQEVLGLSEDRQLAEGDLAAQHVANAKRPAGLSPHAPYSVHPELFRHCVQLCATKDRSLALHLAETPAELELLMHGTGEFRTMLDEFGIYRPELFGGRTWTEFLEPLSELEHALIIHGNYLDDDALRFLGQHQQMTLIYCPRTHAAFGHPPHPWRTLLDIGGSVALGTDSRASNPDLSLWAELQFLAENFPQASQLELLRLATLNGARALNQRANHGSLETGKLANLIVTSPVPDEGPALHQALITSSSKVRGVMQRGQWIVRP